MTLMASADLINIFRKNNPAAAKALFDQHYGRFAAIAARFSKNAAQAEEMFTAAFYKAVSRLDGAETPPPQLLERYFIEECVHFIKSFRSEYFVSSTVYAANTSAPSYTLFDAQEPVDFNNVEEGVLVSALQKLVPAQRLVFNLHVVEGFSLESTAELLETSEPTVKSNLEKARYNLQKNIEQITKQARS